MSKDEQPRSDVRSVTARSGRERAIGVSVEQGREPREVALTTEGSLRAAVTAVNLAQGSSAFPTGRDPRPVGVLGLQRCIGNRAVAQLLRPCDGELNRMISVQRKFAKHQYPNVEAFAGDFKKELDQLPFAKRRACYEALRNDAQVFITAEEIRVGIASWRLANNCPLPAPATQDADMLAVTAKLNAPARSAVAPGPHPSPKAPSSTARDLGLLPPMRPAPAPAPSTSSSSSFSAPKLEPPPSMAVTSDKAEPSSIGQSVKAALAGLSGAQLSKELILERLTEAFGDTAQLHEATKSPELAEALLEEVRSRQSSTWIKATEIHHAKPKAWASEKELQKWNVRHYTNKVTVVLGEEVGPGIFKVADVKPPPFSELLSSITLATMPGTAKETEYKKGGELLMANTSAASTSGHTTVKDWKNIGNVGDTFYGLFYEDEPATGVTPPFIKDAVFFARWSLSEFGSGWASADWLATAAESQTENAKTPGGKAWEGELANIIAEIFPTAAKSEAEVSGTELQRKSAFNGMDNFEIKKHGPMKVAEWLPVEDNIEKIKGWSLNPKKGTFVKLVHSFK